jgi:hypothetical protein
VTLIDIAQLGVLVVTAVAVCVTLRGLRHSSGSRRSDPPSALDDGAMARTHEE